MATFTSSMWSEHPSEPHTGVCAAHFRYSSGQTMIGSHGDVVLLCKIPPTCLVLDVSARVAARPEAGELRVYITRAGGASVTTTLASVGSLSISVLGSPLRFNPDNGFGPFRLSFTASSGDAMYAGLKCQFLNSSATASFSIDGYLLYQRGGKVT